MIMNNIIQLQDFRPREPETLTKIQSYRQKARSFSKLAFDLNGTLAALQDEISEIVNKSLEFDDSDDFYDVYLEERHSDLIASWSKFVKANNPTTATEFLDMWNELDSYYNILDNKNGHKSFQASDVQEIWQAIYTPALSHLPCKNSNETATH